MQTTVRQATTFHGIGLHRGRVARVRVLPAPAGHGIVFVRTDIDGADARIPALWQNVVQEPLNTRIENAAGVRVHTVEHLMAALAGTGIHNALVEIDGPEVPILDGSAAPFVHGLYASGVTLLDAPLRAIRVRERVIVRNGEASAELSPAAELTIRFSIDFDDAAIGHQQKSLSMANGAFARELSDSRTFCRADDVEKMHAAGLALGGSHHNAVVVRGAEVLNAGGLRHRDEAVRHKMLDALGDLATAGAPILGCYTGVRAGHALTNRLLRELFSRPDAFEWVTVDAALASRLPGSELHLSDLPGVA